MLPMFVPGSAELLNMDESGEAGRGGAPATGGEIPYNKRLHEHPGADQVL